MSVFGQKKEVFKVVESVSFVKEFNEIVKDINGSFGVVVCGESVIGEFYSRLNYPDNEENEILELYVGVRIKDKD